MIATLAAIRRADRASRDPGQAPVAGASRRAEGLRTREGRGARHGQAEGPTLTAGVVGRRHRRSTCKPSRDSSRSRRSRDTGTTRSSSADGIAQGRARRNRNGRPRTGRPRADKPLLTGRRLRSSRSRNSARRRPCPRRWVAISRAADPAAATARSARASWRRPYNQQTVLVNTMVLRGTAHRAVRELLIVPGRPSAGGPRAAGDRLRRPEGGKRRRDGREGGQARGDGHEGRLLPGVVPRRQPDRVAAEGWEEEVHPAGRARGIGHVNLRSCAALAVALLLGGVLVAQQNPLPPQPAPTFRSSVQLIEVDVRVFDKDGRFVTDAHAATTSRSSRKALRNASTRCFSSGQLGRRLRQRPMRGNTSGRPRRRPAPLRRRPGSFSSISNHLTPGAGSIARESRRGLHRHALQGRRPRRHRRRRQDGQQPADQRPAGTARRHQAGEAAQRLPGRRAMEMTREWPRLLDEEEAIQISQQRARRHRARHRRARCTTIRRCSAGSPNWPS